MSKKQLFEEASLYALVSKGVKPKRFYFLDLSPLVILWNMRRIAVIFLFLILAILSFYSYRNYSGHPAQTQEPNQKRNVYIITASGLRASHLSSYLYQSIQTPAIDFLAYDGIRFTNAFTNSTESLIAHLSLLSGSYPNHESMKQTYEYLLDIGKHSPPKQLTILPELLARQGYRTAAFLSDPEIRYPSFFATLFHQAFTGDHFLYPWQTAYSPSSICKLAREWVQQNRDIPQFLLVNFDEPTYPFQPPAPYNKQYEKYPYDGEIAGLDEQIGLFVNQLKEIGLFQKSIIVFTAPYGETLEDESRYSGPGNTALQVPLLITAPGLLPRHENYEGQVSLVDVVPTILKLLEISAESNFDGLPLFEKGQNNQVSHPYILGLVPFGNFFGFPCEYYVRTNSYLYVSGINETATRHDSIAVTDQQREAWMQESRKLLKEAGWKRTPLTDKFETDPGLLLEQVIHLAREERPEVAFDLLESFFENVPQNSYLKMLLGSLAAASQDNERGLELLKQAAAISPTLRPLPVLARLQLSANLPGEALETLKKYKRDTALSYDVRSTYALTLSLLGKNQEALLEFDTVLRQNPRYSEAYLYRGKIWKKLGHLSEAEADWEMAIEADWGNLDAYHELASLFEAQGRPADAIPYLRQLLHFEPQNYQVMLQLAELHQKSGNQTEARRLCEQVILKSEDPALKEKAKQMFAGN